METYKSHCKRCFGLPEQIKDYTDDQLVDFVQKGNADAFVELTSRYLSLIRAKAYSFRGCALESDDLCQEGLLGLFAAAKTYNQAGKACFQTYAGICIQNRMVAAYRTCTRQKNIPSSQFVSFHDQEALEFGTREVLRRETNPEALLIDRENLEAVHQKIRQSLSKLEQQVLFLYLSGRSYSEIAANLAVPTKAVDNAIQRVRRKITIMQSHMPR